MSEPVIQRNIRESGRKIGVLGGMFDPVHAGHIQAALEANAVLALDEVRMMPCSSPVHRDAASASNTDRLAMLELATAGNPVLVVDDRECRREGPSWTMLSLQSLRADHPEAVLYLLMGTDTFATLETWYRWQELLDLCHLVIVGRPGARAGYSENLLQLLRAHETRSTAALQQQACGLIYTGLDSRTELSSTVVRDMLKNADPALTGRVPASVLAYIREHGLYA